MVPDDAKLATAPATHAMGEMSKALPDLGGIASLDILPQCGRHAQQSTQEERQLAHEQSIKDKTMSHLLAQHKSDLALQDKTFSQLRDLFIQQQQQAEKLLKQVDVLRNDLKAQAGTHDDALKSQAMIFEYQIKAQEKKNARALFAQKTSKYEEGLKFYKDRLNYQAEEHEEKMRSQMKKHEGERKRLAKEHEENMRRQAEQYEEMMQREARKTPTLVKVPEADFASETTQKNALADQLSKAHETLNDAQRECGVIRDYSDQPEADVHEDEADALAMETKLRLTASQMEVMDKTSPAEFLSVELVIICIDFSDVPDDAIHKIKAVFIHTVEYISRTSPDTQLELIAHGLRSMDSQRHCRRKVQDMRFDYAGVHDHYVEFRGGEKDYATVLESVVSTSVDDDGKELSKALVLVGAADDLRDDTTAQEETTPDTASGACGLSQLRRTCREFRDAGIPTSLVVPGKDAGNTQVSPARRISAMTNAQVYYGYSWIDELKNHLSKGNGTSEDFDRGPYA